MSRQPLKSEPTITASGAVIGRPRAQPPPDAGERIKTLAAEGHSVRGVASGLRVSPEILNRWFDEHTALREAFDDGRERERHTLHNVLYRMATEGSGKESMIASMFLLKARHGYREGDQGEQTNRVSINFVLPGAMKPETYVHESN